MTDQLDMWGQRPHPTVPDIDLRCCDVAEVLAECRGARLVHADPPWSYDSGGVPGQSGWGPGSAMAGPCPYECLSDDAMAEHIDAAWDSASGSAYLVLWTTWPMLHQWLSASKKSRWTYKTGGVWGKNDRLGIGFHWRGDSEPVLIYVKGNPRPLGRSTSNLHLSGRQAHSEKPVDFLCGMLDAWTSPGDLVLDLYAGLAPMARACKATGRRYLGAEIDPERHQTAMARLWGAR